MSTLARFCFRHRLAVSIFWVLALLTLVTSSQVLGENYDDAFELPDTESSRALEVLGREFPGQAGEALTVVWEAQNGTVQDAAVREPVEALLADLGESPIVTGVSSPYSPQGARQVSPDGTVAFASVQLDGGGFDIDREAIDVLLEEVAAINSDAVQVDVGGRVAEGIPGEGEGPPAELIGMAAAAVILLVAFGSLLAMVVPLVMAVFALGAALTTIILLSHVVTLGSVAPALTALIGLGVGIDYALFIVTRHRVGLKSGMDVETSVVNALNTSGRAVVFAGITVCIALLGLFVTGVSFLYGLAIGAAIGVVFTLLVSLTLLPAALGFIGLRVLSRKERRTLADTGPQEESTSGGWMRWAAFVERHPAILAIGATLIIIVLAIPFASIRLGSADQGNGLESQTTRRAYDLLASGFGPGFNGPLVLAAEADTAQALTGLPALVDAIRTQDGVAAVSPPLPAPSGTAALITVYPTTSPQSQETSDLIDRLRADTIPANLPDGTRVYVGGATAIMDDFSNVLTQKLPVFIGVVIALSFLLLLVAFRSIMIPVVGAVMNLLAAGAAFGAVVAVFQWGWGGSLIGLGAPGPIEAFFPVLMFAILFGLSMDYQVFLVSRMHEEWTKHGNTQAAVRIGLAATGKVITAAALIMVAVFVSFVFGGERVIKMFGLGLAVAILLDAVIIRTVLVPAAMQVLGKANWWIPAWLDKVLPHLTIEPEDATHTAEEPSGPDEVSGTGGKLTA